MSDFEALDVPGPSTTDEDAVEYILCTETAKVQMRDALIYYEHLLKKNNLVASQGSGVISQESMLLAEDLFTLTLQILSEKEFVTEDESIMRGETDGQNAFTEIPPPAKDSSDNELIMLGEIDEENAFTEIPPPATDSSDEDDYESEENRSKPDDDDYEPEEKRSKPKEEPIPLDYKIKAVNLARAHPTWSLKSLQSKGCHRLKRYSDLAKWEEQIRSGGTTSDKYEIIDSWTYDRFTEARQNSQQVTTRNLQQWALDAASQFENFHFEASVPWVTKFKRKHNIRERKITKFVAERETVPATT